MNSSKTKSKKKRGKKRKANSEQMDHLCSIPLVIYVKSHLYGDYCYLGYEERTRRVFRPLLEPHVEMELGRTYLFFYRLSEQTDLALPHGRNDLIVESVICVEDMNIDTWVRTIHGLRDLALPVFFDNISYHSSSVTDVFGKSKKTVKFYIEEGTDMSSTGVIITSVVNIYKTTSGKSRIEMCLRKKNPYCGDGSPYELYDFPYTALHTPSSTELMDPNVEKLVIFSMCRPYAGSDGFYPRRCYLLVAGVLLRRN